MPLVLRCWGCLPQDQGISCRLPEPAYSRSICRQYLSFLVWGRVMPWWEEIRPIWNLIRCNNKISFLYAIGQGEVYTGWNATHQKARQQGDEKCKSGFANKRYDEVNTAWSVCILRVWRTKRLAALSSPPTATIIRKLLNIRQYSEGSGWRRRQTTPWS